MSSKSIRILFIQLLLPLSVHAGVSLNRSDTALTLMGSDCRELQAERQTLCDWKKSKKEEVLLNLDINCQDAGDKQFKIPVEDCLPNFIKDIDGSFSLNDGPNCWGSALYSVGILEAPTRAEDIEIEYWTHSKFCTPIQDEKDLKSGDLLSLVGESGQEMSPYDSELHSFIYISKNLIFEKSGEDKKGAFQLRPFDDVLKSWDVPSDCRFRPELKSYSIQNPIDSKVDALNIKKVEISKIDSETRKKFFQKIGSYDWAQWREYEKTNPDMIQLNEKLNQIENRLRELVNERNTIMEARPCTRWVKAYRCQSVREWLKANPQSKFGKLYAEIGGIEKSVDCIYRNNNTVLNPEHLQNLIDQLKVIQTAVEQTPVPKKPKEMILHRGLELRVLTLLDALESGIWLKW